MISIEFHYCLAQRKSLGIWWYLGTINQQILFGDQTEASNYFNQEILLIGNYLDVRILEHEVLFSVLEVNRFFTSIIFESLRAKDDQFILLMRKICNYSTLLGSSLAFHLHLLSEKKLIQSVLFLLVLRSPTSISNSAFIVQENCVDLLKVCLMQSPQHKICHNPQVSWSCISRECSVLMRGVAILKIQLADKS
ncbi:hypothetical protein LWI29_004817 [Acer saccharum]|uniref:Uncharacterized protein n=1 Tax=Acer saccharum TaxID=4024 RepID=A0AA39RIL5_ACESA|nr:hypothetical protein LWI29_004817 [Acer saccharum]